MKIDNGGHAFPTDYTNDLDGIVLWDRSDDPALTPTCRRVGADRMEG